MNRYLETIPIKESNTLLEKYIVEYRKRNDLKFMQIELLDPQKIKELVHSKKDEIPFFPVKHYKDTQSCVIEALCTSQMSKSLYNYEYDCGSSFGIFKLITKNKKRRYYFVSRTASKSQGDDDNYYYRDDVYEHYSLYVLLEKAISISQLIAMNINGYEKMNVLVTKNISTGWRNILLKYKEKNEIKSK